MPDRYQECSECRRLSRYHESALAQQSAFNAAHLAAVQNGNLHIARELSPRLFDTAAGAALAAGKLRAHREASHEHARTADEISAPM